MDDNNEIIEVVTLDNNTKFKMMMIAIAAVIVEIGFGIFVLAFIYNTNHMFMYRHPWFSSISSFILLILYWELAVKNTYRILSGKGFK